CSKRDSYPHAHTGRGFYVPCVYQYRHPGPPVAYTTFGPRRYEHQTSTTEGQGGATRTDLRTIAEGVVGVGGGVCSTPDTGSEARNQCTRRAASGCTAGVWRDGVEPTP